MPETRTGGARGLPLIAILIAFTLFAFSEEFLEAAFDIARSNQPWYPLLAYDLAALVILSWLVGVFRRGTGPKARPVRKGWWLIGSALTLGVDGLMTYLEYGPLDLDPECTMPVWILVLTSLGYVLSLVILLAAAVGLNPLGMVWKRRRAALAWTRFQGAVPLLIGTAGAYGASLVWSRALVPSRQQVLMVACGCDVQGVVHQEYFAQISQVIPLLLVAVGIEAGLFRHQLRDASQRAMTVMTVGILAAGEVLAVSALPWSTDPPQLAGWHEYVAFLVTMEACLVALTGLVWALLIRPMPSRRTASRASGPRGPRTGSRRLR